MVIVDLMLVNLFAYHSVLYEKNKEGNITIQIGQFDPRLNGERVSIKIKGGGGNTVKIKAFLKSLFLL